MVPRRAVLPTDLSDGAVDMASTLQVDGAITNSSTIVSAGKITADCWYRH